MTPVLLTPYQGRIVGPVAKLLGYVMTAIFNLLDKIGIPNFGLAIILFTVVIYIALLPLTYKQQKFSKLQSKMSPELKAIQEKYKGKKDNDSMLAMQQETKEVYAKYGVSQTGSCLQLFIQMPILFALYRVIYSIPAYVGTVKKAFYPLVQQIATADGGVDFIRNNVSSAKMFTSQFDNPLFKSGDVTYVGILKGLDYSIDGEVLRLLKAMPRWIPATKNGVPVRYKVSMPITIRASRNKNQKSSISLKDYRDQ